jgi:hypothetical protein
VFYWLVIKAVRILLFMEFIMMLMINLAIIVTMWHYRLCTFTVVSREFLCVLQSIITPAFINFMAK